MAADKKTLLRDALKLVQAGKIDKAIDFYRAAIKADPRDATVHNTLGDLYAKQGKKKDAIAEYLEASTLYEKDGFGLRAIAVCQKVVNIDPTQLAVRLKLGDLYASQKLPAEARAQYLQVADVHDKKGDIKGALEIFRKIADLDPDNLPVRLKLAGMFEKQKYPDKAAEEYVRAAKGYLDKKETETAVQLYVRAFKLSPANAEARGKLADYYAKRQDWPVVVGLLETPVAKGSRDPEQLVLYADALTRVNHPREAVKVLEPAQEREPNSLPVNLALGRAYVKAGDVEKGTSALNRCVSVHLVENRLEQAEALLGEMAGVAPDDDKILQRALEVAQKRGEKGGVAKAYLRLAAVYEKKGLVRSATGALEKYLELFPDDAAAVRRLQGLKSQPTAPKIEAPPVTAPPPPSPPPLLLRKPPEPEAEADIEVNLEDEGLISISGVEEEEILSVEVEGEVERDVSAAAPVHEPASVADALALIRQGAASKASAFLEKHLGRDPGDRDAWSALVEARRNLGDRHGVRDALLRLADLHRRESRFEEAHAAYRAALDADPRSAAAARGLTELLVAEETAAAQPPAPLPVTPPVPAPVAPVLAPAPPAQSSPSAAGEEEISLDLFGETEEEAAEVEAEAAPAPEPWAPELVPEVEQLAPAVQEHRPRFEPEPAGASEQLEEISAAAAEIGIDFDLLALVEPSAEDVRLTPVETEAEEVLLTPLESPYEEVTPAPAEVEAEKVLLTPVGPWEEPVEEALLTPVEPPEEPVQDVLFATIEPSAEPVEEVLLTSVEPPLEEPEAGGASRGFVGFEEFLDPPAGPAPAQSEPSGPLDLEPEEFNLEGFGESFAAPPQPVVAPPPASGAGIGVAAGSHEYEEFLAEADFYFQQGLLDEAEFLYKKLLQIAPDHPEVTGKLRKLEESRAPEPDAASLSGLDEQLDMVFADQAAAPAEPIGETAPEPVSAAEVDYSSFLADLRQELTAQEMPAPPAPLQGEEGLSEIFQEFQRSVKEQLGDEDFETHYNLGIAYKEMGLMDEAIAEFALAEKSPVRRLNAVSMIALCLREAGRVDEAALKLRTGISLAVEGSEEQKGFLYDLAALHEQAGRTAEAQETLRRLAAIDPGYRDVSSRVAAATPAATPAAPGVQSRKKPKVSYL